MHCLYSRARNDRIGDAIDMNIDRTAPVYLLTPEWPPESTTNGVCTYVGHLRAGMQQVGIQPTILSMSEVQAAVEDSNVIALPEVRTHSRTLPRRLRDALLSWMSPSYSIGNRTSRRIRAAIGGGNTDGTVVLEMEESFGMAEHLRERGFRVVLRLHGPYFLAVPALGLPQSKFVVDRCSAEARAVRFADGISAPSSYVLECASREWDIAGKPTAVIPNPIAPVKDAHFWRDCDSADPYILYVGRFDRLKGADILISAFGEVCKRVRNVRLLFAGPDYGLLDQSRKVWSIDRYVRAHLDPHALQRFEYLGAVTRDRLASLRARAAVAVVSSREESFSYVAAEALAAGCPLVAPSIGGLREMVESGKNGLLYDGEDVLHFADQIERVLNDRELRLSISRNARNSAVQFTPQAVAVETLRFYKSLI